MKQDVFKSSLLLSFFCVSVTVTLFAQEQPVLPTQANAPSDPVPAVEFPVVRQNSLQTRIFDSEQKVIFVKSPAANAKEAVANLLLSDVGLTLVTMALAPQMRMWNPYMNDAIRQGVNLGRGVLVGHGTDTKGFEYDTLPGTTAGVSLKEGNAEFLIPLNNYFPSVEFDASGIQPILVRLEERDRDKARVIASRQVLLKETKTSRFDLKPKVEREESSIDQNVVAADVERLPGNVFRIKPKEALTAGEFALVIRSAGEKGTYSQNVALRPAAHPPAADPSTERSGLKSAFGGSGSPQPRSSGIGSPIGMLRRGQPAKALPSDPAASHSGIAGFIAWDFRIVKN